MSKHKISLIVLISFLSLIVAIELLIAGRGSASSGHAIHDWKLPLTSGRYVVTQTDKDETCSSESNRSHCSDYKTLRCAIDIDLESGEIDELPLLSPSSGKIIDQGFDPVYGSGYYLYIEHDNAISHYQHLRQSRLPNETVVQIGQCVGYVGNSGRITGTHLHFVVLNKSRQDCIIIDSIDGNSNFSNGGKIVSTNQQVGSCPGETPSNKLTLEPSLPPPSSSNNPPNKPSLISPHDWFETTNQTLELCAKENGDPDSGDYVTGYFFSIYDSAQNWESGWTNSSCVITTPLGYFTYKWRVKVRDTQGKESQWSEDWHFTVREGQASQPAQNHPPNEPTLLSPDDGEKFRNITPLLCVNEPDDPDAGDYISAFRFEVSNGVDVWDSGWVYFPCTMPPDMGGFDYSWRAKVRDNHNAESNWSDIWFFSIRQNQPPYPPTLIVPENGWESKISPALLCAKENSDPDEGDRVIAYRFEIFEGAQTWDSDWIFSGCAKPPTLPESQYQWHAKVKDTNGAESAWSDAQNFSITSLPSQASGLPSGQISFIEFIDINTSFFRIMDIDRADVQTPISDNVNSFTWSPDGEEIIYSTKEALHAFKLETGESRVIVHPEKMNTIMGNYYNFSDPVFLPNNQSIYFHADDGRAQGDTIRKLDLSTNVAYEFINPRNFQSFDVSPTNGDLLVVGCGGGRTGCDMELYNSNGSFIRKLFNWEQGFFFADLAWSPNGEIVAFSSYPDLIGDWTKPTRIQWLSMVVGELSLRTFEDSYKDRYPEWSPDGKWMVFSRTRVGEQNADLWVLSIDGKTLINITNTPEINEVKPAWRP